jgi:anti-sigma B factor antagonist
VIDTSSRHAPQVPEHQRPPGLEEDFMTRQQRTSRTGDDDARAVEDERVVQLSEALVAEGLADARWLLHEALLSGARRIVVDLSRVSQLASPALASFLWAHRICRARGGAVVLRGADRRTEDMLRRTGLWRVLQVQTTRCRTAA